MSEHDVRYSTQHFPVRTQTQNHQMDQNGANYPSRYEYLRCTEEYLA